jgi:pilus assembly protein CpaE
VQKKTEIMVAGRSKSAIAELASAIASPSREVTEQYISNGHSNPLYYAKSTPEILIFHLSAKGPEEIESLLENKSQAQPIAIIVGPANNVECMRMSMQAGVRDYIEEPADIDELKNTVDRIVGELHSDSASSTSKEGEITALVSAKGGAGASFLSANLAHMAASQENTSVALIDMDLQFGSLAQYLDLKLEHGLMKALEIADQLDAVALDAYMAKHTSGLRLLSPVEDEIILPRDIIQSQFSMLLELMKDSYQRTFIDLPRQIDELSAEVYERANQIMIITQQEVASIRDASRLYRLIRNELDIPESHFFLVINRYDKNSDIEIADISRSTGIDAKQFITVPNSYQSVAESINVGVPMFDHAKNSRVTRALMAMNAKLSGSESKHNPNVVRRVLANLLGG